jgi:hypothetical protein
VVHIYPGLGAAFEAKFLENLQRPWFGVARKVTENEYFVDGTALRRDNDGGGPSTPLGMT